MTTAEIIDAEHVHDEHDHEHLEGEGEHSHEPDFSPQPVPMGINARLVPTVDGSDRVMVTYVSVNGSWTVFYDRDGAIQHAQTLLGLAYQPPAQAEPESA